MKNYSISGSMVKFYIDNIPIAYAMGISINFEQTLTEIREIDNLEVVEFAESGFTVRVITKGLILRKNSLLTLPFKYTSNLDLLSRKDLKITVRFEPSGSHRPSSGSETYDIITIEGAKLAKYSIDGEARSSMKCNMEFVGKSIDNEVFSKLSSFVS